MGSRALLLLWLLVLVLSWNSIVVLSKEEEETDEEEEEGEGLCGEYGCPLIPVDAVFDAGARSSLTKLNRRAIERRWRAEEEGEEMEEEDFVLTIDEDDVLSIAGSSMDGAATLTMKGEKGRGSVNQDRSFVFSPYVLPWDESIDAELLGSFDGHSPNGEHVSEHVATELPKLLSQKLRSAFDNDQSEEQQQQEETVKQILKDCFVELDKTAPAHLSGGTTASVVFRFGPKLYVANAGDSQSIVAVFDSISKKVQIVYKSREDKPHLPDERRRIEAAGAYVSIPNKEALADGDSSRVVIMDEQSKRPVGLAMSRSIGDWKFPGVTPVPIVDVLDLHQLSDNPATQAEATCANNDENQCSSSSSRWLFAVSATDGLLDFIDTQQIMDRVAIGLFTFLDHPLLACHELILNASNKWELAMNGQYRDDITIAVASFASI